MADGASQHRLKAKQQFYDDLDGALNESDDAADPGRQASIAAMERARARQIESSTSSRRSRGLPRSTSDSKLASRDPASDQAPRPSLSGGEHRPPLQKGATFSAEPSKAMAPTAPPSAIPRSIVGKRKRDSDIKYVPDAQQIFKGLHFYFFPNDDKNHARAMRIIKAIEFGATWQKDWNQSVTHVVVDKAIDYNLLLRFLKLDRLPEHVVLVSENYPASCVSYRAILDARQGQFRVKGAPEPLKTIEPIRGLPQSSAESDKSLQLKPAGKSVVARQPETQQTTVTEAHSSSQTRIGSSVANIPDPGDGQAAHKATEQEDIQSSPDTSEEFEAAVKQARELRDLPLEHEEEEDARPISSDGPPDTDEEEQAPSSFVKQRKNKAQSMQDKFQCMQKHTGDKPGNPNAHTIDILQQMADYYGQIGDEWRIRAYRKAIGTLRNHPVKVWTMEEALALPQIGPRLAKKIEEIAITNRLRRLDNARAEPTDQVLQTFMGVYGAGLAKASEWVAAGYKTLDDVLEKADLTENQRVGIDHYADFHTRIPRAEVEMHGSTVRRALHRIDDRFQVIIGGSYRRGSKDSGDIDCIITRPDTGLAHLRNVVLGQLVPELFKAGFLVASLAITRRDDGSKWHGASQLPSPQMPNPNPWRRVDFFLVPSDEIGAALIYFTGNDIFNRSLRLLASTKGMRLNQRGLYKDCMRGKGRVKITEGELVEAKVVLLSVAFATCASTLVNKYSLYAKQSGIPEIKTVLGGFVIRRFLGAWTLVVKSLGLCLAVASGMWLGKEGPLVHVACCCANVFMKLFAPSTISANEARKREAFSAAAASGISVAFGSPIGGVLFSLEQLSYYFPDKTMWASFVCAMVAAVTLQAFDPFRTGKLVLYQVSYHSGWHAFELVPFALIGILGGLYGAMFIKLNMRIASWRASARNMFVQRPVLEVLIVAFATALISFPVTFLRAQSSELVEHLFAECKDIQDDYLGLCRAGIANTGVIFALILSGLLGFLLTTVTFGLQIPAGILLPSMAIGAIYGRVVGLVMEVWQQQHPNFIAFSTCEPDILCVTPGTYAVIGAASALAGATRMTVSIVVIMFELTGALTYVLPIMIAVMLSKWVGDAFGKRGIYESWISIQGYPFLDNKIDDAVVPDVPVNNIMTRVEDLICITATGHSISSLQELLQEHQFRGYPVIASLRDPTLLGYISRTELAFALSTAVAPSPSGRALPPETECFFAHQPLADPTITLDLRPWMDQTPITLNSRTSFQLVRDMFEKLGLRYLVFTDRGELAGLLTKKDLWYVLNEGDVGGRGYGAGVLREEVEGREDERGLLGGEEDEDGDGRRRDG